MKLSILVSSFLISSLHLYSCSCIGERTVKNEIKASDFVFIGKVISKTVIQKTNLLENNFSKSRRNLDNVKITMVSYVFEVKTRYKGRIKSNQITIVTGVGNGDCGFPFVVGKDYIVYANFERHNSFKNNTILTDVCKRTNDLNQKEIDEIQKFRRPK